MNESNEEAFKALCATRHNAGKLRWSLLDPVAMQELLKVLEHGATKYGRDNWKKGLPVTSIADSLMRHLMKFLSGENEDGESGLSHVGHILCNAMFLAHMHVQRVDMDDRK